MAVEKIALIGGPPGSGKSSVASRLSSQTRLGYMSTGEHIRAISKGTATSRYRDAIIAESETLSSSGRLPQSLVCAVIEEHFKQADIENDLLLDGYPKSIEQVKPFLDTLEILGSKALVLVYLDIDREEAIQRMLFRGDREGEQPINIDFARIRHEHYTGAYSEVITALSNKMPVRKVQASSSLDDNVATTRHHLEDYFGDLRI